MKHLVPGDRINLYITDRGRARELPAMVVFQQGDGVEVHSLGQYGIDATTFHRKQCRLIVKKQRERIFISQTALDTLAYKISKTSNRNADEFMAVSKVKLLDDDVEFVRAKKK